jgi:hypothetical protein
MAAKRERCGVNQNERNEMKTMDKCWADAAQIAQVACRNYCEDILRGCYAYAGNNQVTVIRECEPNPEGMMLVTGERLPRNMTVEQLTGWVANHLKRTPYLVEEVVS